MRVVLGVAGGIAAYKACELLRLFTESGHQVRVVPTAAALEFVGAPTWAALSGQPVTASIWDDVSQVPHVRIGQDADLVIIAPATADLMARAAAGTSDDLLTAVLLTARCPVVFAPAMHTEMWEHPATAANVATLRSRGCLVVEPASGRLTGKDTGPGRLPEPAELFFVAAARARQRGRGPVRRPGRPPRAGLGRRHQGGTGPGPVSGQLVIGPAGLRARPDRREPRCGGHARRGEQRPARPGGSQGDPGQVHAADARGDARRRAGRGRDRDGGGRRRLPPGRTECGEDQEDRGRARADRAGGEPGHRPRPGRRETAGQVS